jgi:hypothetical protein
MKREVVDCDRCGKENIEEYGEFQAFIDTQTDAAGGPSEDIGPIVHLCVRCMRNIVGVH